MTLLYDCQRDRNLQHGEAILVYEDGSTERIIEGELPPEPQSARQIRMSELPPAQDLLALIRKEHFRAELIRLRAGYDGCGCPLCQELYTKLDLKKYGDRVKHYDGAIVINAGKTGADLWDDYHKPDYWRGEVFFTGGHGYGVASNGDTVCLGPEKDVLEKIKGGIHERTRHEVKPVSTQRVSRQGDKRTRPATGTQYKPVNTRQVKTRKKLPVNKAEYAKPRLFD